MRRGNACSWMAWTPPVRPSRSDTRAPASSTANTAASSASHLIWNPQEVLLHPYCTQIFGINSSPSRIISTESRLLGKVLLQDDTREQRRHLSGIQLRVDSKPSHSVYECSSADTQSDCSAIRTAYAALARGKRLYDFLALLPFVLLSAGVDIRS